MGDLFSQLDFPFGGNPKAGSLEQRCLEGSHDFQSGVPQNERSPGLNIIDVTIPVHIVHMGSVSRGDKQGIPLNGFEGTYRAIDTAGNDVPGSLPQFMGSGKHTKSPFHGRGYGKRIVPW